MKRLFAPVLLLGLLALAPRPAVAAQEPPVMVSEEELTKIENMAGEARDKYLEHKRKELEGLSIDARNKKRAEREKAFAALPEAKQKELQERMHKLRLDIRRERFEKMALSPEEREEKIKAFLNTLSPEQRRLWYVLAEEREKWEKAPLAGAAPAEEKPAEESAPEKTGEDTGEEKQE